MLYFRKAQGPNTPKMIFLTVKSAAPSCAELAPGGGKNAVSAFFKCEQPALTVIFETNSQKCHTPIGPS